MDFSKLENIVNYDIEHGFSGAAISVVYQGQKIYQKMFGYAHRYDSKAKEVNSPQKLTEEMLFDIASITKIFGTTYAIMYLYERKLIDLDVKITG